MRNRSHLIISSSTMMLMVSLVVAVVVVMPLCARSRWKGMPTRSCCSSSSSRQKAQDARTRQDGQTRWNRA